MARYYVHCQNHGKVSEHFGSADAASKKRMNYLLNQDGPHGTVSIIEEFDQEKIDSMTLELCEIWSQGNLPLKETYG